VGELLRTSELAKLLGVPQQKIYQWAKKGLPLKNTPQGTRVDLDEARQFLGQINVPTPALPSTPSSTGEEEQDIDEQTPAPSAKEPKQVYVWPKQTTKGVTVASVKSRSEDGSVVLLKCDDGTEAPFTLTTLQKLIRSKKIAVCTPLFLVDLLADIYSDRPEVLERLEGLRHLLSG